MPPAPDHHSAPSAAAAVEFARVRTARILAAASAAAVLLLAPPSPAGDYHTGSTLRCSDCHVMHFSQSHDYAPNRPGATVPLSPRGANKNLLRQDVNDLCLSCHDGSAAATDVMGPVNSGDQPNIVRLGGYVNRLGVTAVVNTGHTLDSLENAPDSVPTWNPANENGAGRGLTCINCHDPHGAVGTGHPTGSQYRNLKVNPGTGIARFVTYNGNAANNLARDVYVRRSLAYDESQVDWNEPNTQRSALARWCGGCHSRVHGNRLDGGSGGGGSGTGGGSLSEHPVEGENLESSMRTRYNSHVNRVKVLSSTGIWYPAGSDATPSCMTCHKAHGNGRPRGLIWRSGTGQLTEDGDSNGTSQGNLCLQCHDSANPD